MKRIALLLGAVAAALAFAGSALAAFSPKLVITHDPLTPQGGGKTDIAVSFDQNDDATFRAVIYAAVGYTGSLGAPGQKVGTAEAQVLTSIAPTQPIPVTGAITADDPSKYTASATQCTQSPTHTIVWLLQLEAAGQQLTVPAYVDALTAPPEAALGSFKITVCLPSPYIPASAGGATLGAKLVSATLHLSNVFVLPDEPKEWTAPPNFKSCQSTLAWRISSSNASTSLAGTNGSSAPCSASTLHFLFLPSSGLGESSAP